MPSNEDWCLIIKPFFHNEVIFGWRPKSGQFSLRQKRQDNVLLHAHLLLTIQGCGENTGGNNFVHVGSSVVHSSNYGDVAEGGCLRAGQTLIVCDRKNQDFRVFLCALYSRAIYVYKSLLH